MWNWTHLGIFFGLRLLVCLCGFKKYVYFMSIGYGFSVAVIGAAMAVMSCCAWKRAHPEGEMTVTLAVQDIRVFDFVRQYLGYLALLENAERASCEE